MAVDTLTVPGRTYPVGITRGQRAMPRVQTYSHVDVTVDFTGWTDPATTEVLVTVEMSLDGGATWRDVCGFSEKSPPPYAQKSGGSGNSVTVNYNTAGTFDPTHMRGSVTVSGQAVTLGQIVINAS